MKFLDMILLPQDKANHIVDGGAIFLIVAGVLKPFNLPFHREIALGASCFVGLAKELYDLYTTRVALRRGELPTHTADPMDFVATCLGGLACYMAGEL